MIIRKSTYERNMLRAFQKGRESKFIASEDDAVKMFAELNGFSTKAVPKILNKSVFGMPGSGKVSSILVKNDDSMDNVVYSSKYEGKYGKVLEERKE